MGAMLAAILAAIRAASVGTEKILKRFFWWLWSTVWNYTIGWVFELLEWDFPAQVAAQFETIPFSGDIIRFLQHVNLWLPLQEMVYMGLLFSLFALAYVPLRIVVRHIPFAGN